MGEIKTKRGFDCTLLCWFFVILRPNFTSSLWCVFKDEVRLWSTWSCIVLVPELPQTAVALIFSWMWVNGNFGWSSHFLQFGILKDKLYPLARIFPCTLWVLWLCRLRGAVAAVRFRFNKDSYSNRSRMLISLDVTWILHCLIFNSILRLL